MLQQLFSLGSPFTARSRRVRLWAAAGLSLGMASSALAAEFTSVSDFLAAGEFANAQKVARQLPAGEERQQALAEISAAQAAAGESRVAMATARGGQGSGGKVSGKSGGGMVSQQGGIANPAEIMQFIQTIIPGSWEEDGGNGAMQPSPNFATGVKIQPQQALRPSKTDASLSGISTRARLADTNADAQQQSELRVVSLRGLEQAAAERLASGKSVTESMSRMAGLTSVNYVFVDEANQDILLAGPADGWEYNARGDAMAAHSKHPTLNLDDFVVVLRAFVEGHQDFGCSINTRESGVQALQKLAAESQAKGAISAGRVGGWVKQLQKALGPQDVVVWGIPADTRVARVIVEADYRMKLIGVDKLDAGKSIPSYFDLLPATLQKDAPNMEALRWWLSLKCDSVLHSEDKNAFEIRGSAVRCLSENQQLTAEGKHLPTGKSEPVNRQFAENFTANYERLSERDTVFADCSNVFGMSLAAALICQDKLAEKAGFSLGTFAPGGLYEPAKYAVPKELDSVVNHRVYRGRDIVVQVAGGVRTEAVATVSSPDIALVSTAPAATALKAQSGSGSASRWWWDAK